MHLGKTSVQVKDLRRRIRRRVEGEAIVDGRRLVDDLIRWDLRILELYLHQGFSESAEAVPWIAAADRVFEVNPDVLSDLAPTRNPQGVLAVVEAPQWPVWPAVDGVGLW